MTKISKTTAERADNWDVYMPLLRAMQTEFQELSRKKPEAAISKGKVAVVNRLLESCRSVLADEKSLRLLDLLQSDDLPQNSDVSLMLSQYVAAMKEFRESHYSGSMGWVVK